MWEVLQRREALQRAVDEGHEELMDFHSLVFTEAECGKDEDGDDYGSCDGDEIAPAPHLAAQAR